MMTGKKIEDEGRSKGKKRISASFVTGAVALVFLVTGYQAALFLHKAAALKIIADRDSPDTVYVISKEMAREVLSAGIAGEEGFRAYMKGLPSEDVGSLASDGTSGSGGDGNVYVRKNASHSPAVSQARAALPSRNVESFVFNPNTVSVGDLVRLGFTEKQARSIDNYRSKGGRFRRKTDFAKSYVVSDSVYKRLEAYIDIPLLDLNLADSADFDGLPGIGGYFASRMVEYRRRLGGYYSYKEQLMDIYNFDKGKYDGLADLVTVDTTGVRPYPLWTLPEDSLRLHPYIGSYAVAHGIVLYRENNPASEWNIPALEKAGILKADMAGKLSGCIIEKP